MANEGAIFETKLRVENKDIFIDVKKNDNGTYLKISERNRNNRSTILVPASGIGKLIEALSEAAAVTSGESKAAPAGGKGKSPAASTPRIADEKKIFVTNLPFDTSSADLLSFYNNTVGSKAVATAEVILRKNGRSTGSGTVEFHTNESAVKAIAATNGATLGERTLAVREYYQNK